MCGIFGIWHLDGRPVDLAMVRAATNRMRHRGPDDEGYLLVNTQNGHIVQCGGDDTDPALNLPPISGFYDQPFDLALGFRRLAILDLSSAGHQPMAGTDGSCWIVHNGEIYNYLELRAELAGCGYEFHTGTDTEIILAAYRQWGVDSLTHFNGMWAFALWDVQKRRLFLARDRFGVKPLYYVNGKGRYAFASEIKALIGDHGAPFVPEDEAVYRYLVGGQLPSPQEGQTFFKGVQALPPGHWMTVQPHAIVKRRFWMLNADSGASSEKGAAQVVARYRDLLINAVRLRLRSDVPVGTCLSGGLDSSAIVCIINRLMAEGGLTAEQIGRQQKTFSAVYETAGPHNERLHIERVLEATGAEKNFIYPTLEWLQADVEHLVWHQDEPFLSTSIFAQWCVMSRVHERGVKVLLDGQGADEALGGYRPFAIFLSDWVRRGGLVRALREAHAIRAQTGVAVSSLLARTLFWQLPGSWVRTLRQRHYTSRHSLAALQPDFAKTWRGCSVVESPWTNLQEHLIDQMQESSLPHLLRYEDRNSMAFGIEARAPYLDYRLVEFSFGEAAGWRIYDGWTKWVLREAMAGTVPNEIVWRRDKVGFETPEAAWLKAWVHSHPDMFDGGHSRQYLNLDVVCQKLASWVKVADDVHAVWRWINLELWLRVWNERSGRTSSN